MTTLQTPDRITLPITTWLAPPPSRGTVLIVHGLGEHIGRYAHVAADLNARGWNVVGYDQRGHGKAGGARGVIAQADDLLNDLAQVIDHVRTAQPPRLVLLGHSMGGAVVARMVTGQGVWVRKVDAAVLSSPALDTGIKLPQKILLAVMHALAPGVGVDNGLKAQFVARDPAVVAAYQSDPLVHRKVSARLVRFIIDAGADARRAAPSLALRTLLFYAGEDKLVSPEGSRAFAAAAPVAMLTQHCYAPMYHETLNDPDKAQVLNLLGEWLTGV